MNGQYSHISDVNLAKTQQGQEMFSTNGLIAK